MPGYELRVLGEDRAPVGTGEVGLLVARGPTGTVYWRDPEKQEVAVRGGWSRVGDFVTLDADGYVWFMSREDDLIKSSGYRIGPEEVEEALAKHPAVADVGVIGVADPVRGQNTRAYVALQARGRRRPTPSAESSSSSAGTRSPFTSCPGRSRSCRSYRGRPGPPGPGTGELLRRVLREQVGRA